MIKKPTPEQIKALRAAMGWSQYDVARLLHLNSSTMVSRYECGTRKMCAAFWELLCIKATDQRYNIHKRREEIERHRNSRVYVAKLLNKAK